MWLFKSKSSKESSSTVSSNEHRTIFLMEYDYGHSKAREILAQANNGNVNAMLEICKCMKKNNEYKIALRWYEKAAGKGNKSALYELSFFYEGKYQEVPADNIKAEKVRNALLEKNDPQMLCRMGSKYHSGDGVPQSFIQAFTYYLKAAKLGHNEAMAEVGQCYLKGEGVLKDGSKAFYWLSRSNDPRNGFYYLSQCYQKGIGTAVDLNKATFFLEKAVAAKCFEFDAEEQLLALYKKGYGGPDRVKKMKIVQDNRKATSDLFDRLLDTF